MAELPLEDDTIEMDASAAAMAEAMGFSGFGMQKPAGSGNKKRKFNPHADASISGLPKKPTTSTASSASRSTGANSAPLGERVQRPLPPPSASLPSRPTAVPAGRGPVGSGNADEVDLDDDDGDEDGVDGAGLGEAVGAGADRASSEVDAGAQAHTAVVDNGPPGLDAHAASHSRKKQHAFQNQHQQHQQPRGKAGHHGGGGQSGEKQWWEGYWDDKMIENPWDRLEKQKGLDARGVWPLLKDAAAQLAQTEAKATGTTTQVAGDAAAVGLD